MPDRIVIFAALALVIVMFAGTLSRLGNPQAAPPITVERITKQEPPRQLPPLELIDAAGAQVALGAQDGKPTVVAFWATWCTPCLREIPTLAQFQAAADKAGFRIVTVTEDKEGIEPAKRWLEQKGIAGLPLLADPDNSVSRALGVRGLPTTLILNAKGEELARIEGETDWSGKGALETVTGLLDQGAPAR